MPRSLSVLALALLATGCAQLQDASQSILNAIPSGQTDYKTAQGQTVHFPLGAVAFADRLVSFRPTRQLSDANTRAENTLGPPDCGGDCAVALTSGGVLVVEFTNNTLYDGPGDDLAIFEVGPDVEATRVEISVDGRQYVDLGTVRGASSTLDIGGRGPQGARYRFVRLTDDPDQGDTGGSTPGADIDAIGAIHAERR